MDKPSKVPNTKDNLSISELNGPCSMFSKASQVMGSTFFLDERYEIIDTISSGAHGIVVSARDTKTGEMVAIKKIEKAFEHSSFTKCTLRGLKIMRLLNHENLIRIKSIQLPKSREEFDEIYVVSELMETDLSSVIKSPQPLSDEYVQFFLYQLLRGLKFMHSACILHRDLQPRNLLVNSNCNLKICHFGLARPFSSEIQVKSSQITDCMPTHYNRAPEVLLTDKKYTRAMDMWSVGCIFGELLIRKPLLPGTDTNHHIEIIFNLLGTPTETDIESIPNFRVKEKVLRMVKSQVKPHETVFRDCNPQAIDLLKKMLEFNPEKRITVEAALNHPYLSTFHFRDDEPVITPVSLFDFVYETQLLTMRDLKDLMYEEILLYHFVGRQRDYYRSEANFLVNVFKSTSSQADYTNGSGSESENEKN